jgi:hypothetical protein
MNEQTDSQVTRQEDPIGVGANCVAPDQAGELSADMGNLPAGIAHLDSKDLRRLIARLDALLSWRRYLERLTK